MGIFGIIFTLILVILCIVSIICAIWDYNDKRGYRDIGIICACLYAFFAFALDYYQNKDEVSVVESQSILLSVHDTIRKELNNRFYKLCMDILEQNPHLANRHCCGNYMLPYDKIEIKFNKL